MDTNGTYRIVQYSEASLSQGLLMCTVEPSLVDTNGTSILSSAVRCPDQGLIVYLYPDLPT